MFAQSCVVTFGWGLNWDEGTIGQSSESTGRYFLPPMDTDSVTRVEEKERRGSVSEDESAARPMAEVIDAEVAVAVHRGVTSGNCTVVGFRGVANADQVIRRRRSFQNGTRLSRRICPPKLVCGDSLIPILGRCGRGGYLAVLCLLCVAKVGMVGVSAAHGNSSAAVITWQDSGSTGCFSLHPIHHNHTYISVVVAGRNDNYGGGKFLDRVQLFVDR